MIAPRFTVLAVLCAAGALSHLEAENVIPTQFIAKMYTEALGRAPDPSGWSAYTGYFVQNGCGAGQLMQVGEGFYTSPEFSGDYSNNEAKVIALYRGALNRDPDPSGFAANVAALNSGTSWGTIVDNVFSSAEFNGDVPTICSATSPDYGFGSQPPVTPAPGAHGYSGPQVGLQALLELARIFDLLGVPNATTVYLAERAVIPLTSSLVIPTGVTLTTYGAPPATSYAMMARLIRASTFDGPNVDVDPGGIVTNVWIDGQRNVLGYFKPGGGPKDNANVVTLGGANTVVSHNKLSEPQGGTNFFSSGGSASAPCANQAIHGNLVTAYTAVHGFSQNSDGLTMLCEGLDIRNNDIVDVSDIGIVLFAAPGVTQKSQIFNNTIVSAGNSMNAPISADPSTGNPAGSSLDYSGTVFEENTFWTGPYTTFDFGVEAGAREYFPTAMNSDGSGATYINNTTTPFSAQVRAGIAVAGMLNVTITNDGSHPLNFILVNFPSGTPAAVCPSGMVIAEASTGHASGTYPAPAFNGNFDNCVN